jgi:polysaccharide biosynthesis transport protein
LRVVQRAITPSSPVFPQVPQLIGLALVGGILLGLALIIGPELARGATGDQEKPALGVGDDDLVDLLVARRRREGSKDLHAV